MRLKASVQGHRWRARREASEALSESGHDPQVVQVTLIAHSATNMKAGKKNPWRKLSRNRDWAVVTRPSASVQDEALLVGIKFRKSPSRQSNIESSSTVRIEDFEDPRRIVGRDAAVAKSPTAPRAPEAQTGVANISSRMTHAVLVFLASLRRQKPQLRATAR